jgi:hypothetical protein
MIAAVDQQDVDVGSSQRTGRGQAAESSADDDDARSAPAGLQGLAPVSQLVIAGDVVAAWRMNFAMALHAVRASRLYATSRHHMEWPCSKI